MSLGAEVVGGAVRFTVWAPSAALVEVILADGRAVPMEPQAEDGNGKRGTHEVTVDGLGAGDTYSYRIDGKAELPDPASRHQPRGVAGPSAIVDSQQFVWTDHDWPGRSLRGAVIHELHVGTFTPTGTFDGVIAELKRLFDLGVTHLELMPINAFPGDRNWGYDGVFPFATQHSYGGPAGLDRLIDAAHGFGLGVIIDVVHNHIGPEGNVLPQFGPYFTDTYHTPWGPALNFSEQGSDQVRRFFIESAVQWITDHHADGLRLDAVHAIVDPTAKPFLEELTAAVHEAGAAAGREVLVIAESSANDPSLIAPVDRGGIGCDAVWNDDFHHALRVAVTDDTDGYYADFAGGAADLASALANGWVYQGQYSGTRGRKHGRPVVDARPEQFVVFSQNHDQIGNRMIGDRLDHHLDPARRGLVAATVLLSPFTPMLFMGEEYGDPAPFPFFVDHQDRGLLDAVRSGRKEEFSSFGWRGDPPDPGARETFESAVLDSALSEHADHLRLAELYRRLLHLRRTHPELAGWPEVEEDDGLIEMRHLVGERRLTVVLNFSDRTRHLETRGDLLLATSDSGPQNEHEIFDLSKPWTLEPWSAAAIYERSRTATGNDPSS